MQKDELQKKIIAIPTQVVKDLPKLQSSFSILGKCIRPMLSDKDMTEYQLKMHERIVAFTNLISKSINPESLNFVEEILVNDFCDVYVKSVELLHLLKNGKGSEFDIYADLSEQEYINSQLENLQFCALHSIRRVQNMQALEFQDDLTIPEIIGAYLTGAAFLALQNYLREVA